MHSRIAAFALVALALAGCSSSRPTAALSPAAVEAPAAPEVEGPVDVVDDGTPLAEPAAYAPPAGGAAASPVVGARSPYDHLIAHYARVYDVPEALVHRVVKRESTYNPRAYNRGHYGLMQIKPATARGMGYRGPASGLFDAETNLRYAVKYLRGAWLLADGSHDRAVRLYAAGYYYEAKRRGMLVETGLRPG